ncbi:hypothetical protein CHUAL_002470 [Chamberlinius hualienensis]
MKILCKNYLSILIGSLILLDFIITPSFSEEVLSEVTKTELEDSNVDESDNDLDEIADQLAGNVSNITILTEDGHIESSITEDGEILSNTTAVSETSEVNKTSGAVRFKKVKCTPRNETNINLTVQIVSGIWPTALQNSPGESNSGLCYAVLYYTPSCHFSAVASPHYNALARIFPDVLCLAVNATAYSSQNARLGIIGFPTVMLFHGNQPVSKFSDSQYTLERFVEFITKHTGLNPAESANVTSADFEGPLPNTPTTEADLLLWLAWIFITACATVSITKTSFFNRIVEALWTNWNEAEAQHQHED